MKTEILLNLLSFVNYVTSNKWQTVMDIVDCINNEHTEIIKKKWADDWKNVNPDYNPLDLSNIKTWSTFDSCVNLEFKNKDGKLYCFTKIYDGDNYNGCPKDLRFSATIILPDSFVQKLENNIQWKFDEYLVKRYEEHLENQKKEWINNLKNQILEYL